MNTETSLATKVCNYKPLPGASTIGEVIGAAGLHPDEVVAEILIAGDRLRADEPATLLGQMALPLVINLLAEYQRWRRGAEMEQPDPRRLGLALNSAIAHLRLLQKIRLPWIIEGLDNIGGLSRHLRQSGPDSMDLHGLDEGLRHAIDLATELRDELVDLPSPDPVTLWCMHILGPDDVYPAPSKAHAEMAAGLHNKLIAKHANGRDDVLCHAQVAQWPHSDASHAEGVGKFITTHLIPVWQLEADTDKAPNILMQMIQKATFPTSVDKRSTLELASIMVPAPAQPAATAIVPEIEGRGGARSEVASERAEEVEEVAACLGDDAAAMLDENPEDERALNMKRAAELLTSMQDSPKGGSDEKENG